MNACLHTSFKVHAEVQRYADGAAAPAQGFTLQCQVVCADCHTQFQFDSDATIPGHDEPGAFINAEGWKMEVPIAPMPNSISPAGS